MSWRPLLALILLQFNPLPLAFHCGKELYGCTRKTNARTSTKPAQVERGPGGQYYDEEERDSEDFRRLLWKHIAELESEAKEKLIDMNETDNGMLSLTFAALLRQADPLSRAAAKYLAARRTKNGPAMKYWMEKAMKLGPTPPMAQRVSKVREEIYGPMRTEEVNMTCTRNRTITEGIEVTIFSRYSKNESDPERGIYMFRYNVTITNRRKELVQLIARVWEIETYQGEKEVVRGVGIVGKQPVLDPGQSFSYESVCPLRAYPAPEKRYVGKLLGTYVLVRGQMGDTAFTVRIGECHLILPRFLNL
jgi:ApaG protein